ncbi:dual E2 ubiquitin-conjugating enzyme/E3 ubiquitin-protein ligase BIRC6-like isoform X3 [Littorina saxatilis]|uniref:dual E2 ubiquitin-conjugating enzyme/E3 ubiquitin-protein ligase BIRC6-like isoform X3 n=1 Tax=Littorina saxatilis TaxID=31220 RepID=UPI0038B523AA
MAATDRQWSVVEDGCLFIDKNLKSVTYHSSLNSIVLSSKDQTITVLDATSGIVLKKSDLSGQKCEALQCIYLGEKERCVFSDSHAVCVRRDLRGILLLDTALQIPVNRTEDVIKLEIPLAEALQLSKALSSIRFEAGCDHLTEVTEELARGIETARQDTEGSHKTAKWATVCLQLQHSALRLVCSTLVSEMKRVQQGSAGSQQGPGMPIASAIIDRLVHLLPSSIIEVGPGSIDKALMYSEAARRQTFSKWPHMGYKWALPEPMAQAGFYHQPNAPGDDRAMCFTCNVCLVCWEPTDEPWSEHERHSPNCPYIKGEYTQNVPLSVTYATHPAQLHGGAQDKIACISTTSNEDFIATSTRDGNIVVWDISHILKKRCSFNLDSTDAIVAIKTGLQIERSKAREKTTDSANQDQVDSRVVELKEELEGLSHGEGEQECVQEILLHHEMEVVEEVKEERKRPSNDLIVSALSIMDWSCRKENDQLTPSACSPSKGTDCAEVVHPSLVCGVSLRRTKCAGLDSTNAASSPKLASSVERRSEVVQLMNRVNEGVRNEDLRIISDVTSEHVGDDFSLPDSSLNPYLLVVTFDGKSGTGSSQHGKHKGKGGGGGGGGLVLGGGLGGGHSSKMKGPVPAMEGGNKVGQMNSLMANDTWSMLLESDPWLDPDVQIVGFTPSPAQASPLKDGPTSISKPVPILQNGPSDLTSSFSGFGSEGSSPQSPNMHMPVEVMSELKKKENMEQEEELGGAKRPGMVLQCVQLPQDFSSETLEVRSIQPTIDRRYAIVVVAPRSEYMESAQEREKTAEGHPVGNSTNVASSEPMDITPEVEQLGPAEAASSADLASPVFGGLLVYKVKSCSGRTQLEETPCMTYRVQQAEQVIGDIFVLPPEVAEQMDEEELGSRQSSPMATAAVPPGAANGSACPSTNGIGAIGQVSLILTDGSMMIINLADARVISSLAPEDGDGFISATYCTGIERLCMCTQSGKLKFYQVNQQQEVGNSHSRSADGVSSKTSMSQDAIDGKKGSTEDENFEASPGKAPAGDYLASGPLVPETLTALHSLTEFENLMPRFTATVPPCWSEIQQEQQQRRHPQHLQQQGEATQHTRTWKLTQNGSTWDDHLFEIVLPKPCCVGHVDVKFTLHPLCTTAPNIEVTLLKQNIGSMGRHIPIPAEKETKKAAKRDSEDKDNINYVLDPAFLQKNNAEILCGPMKLGNCLSGSGGLASLSSPKLLNSKPRSLLLHVKGFKNKEESAATGAKGASASSSDKPEKESKKKMEYKTIKCLFENVSTGAVPSAAERLAATAPKQKLTDIKGCDWLAELSVTVRKFRRTSVSRERQQRNAMLENMGFHERLLCAVTSPPADLQGMSAEHFQNLALDILLWIGAVQVNDPNKRNGTQCLVLTIQPCLKDLVKSCFIEAPRTTAHKCARLLALCIEYAKMSDDIDLAPSFSFQLLQAQVDCLPLLVSCGSAGSLKWFFVLLNRVKCMDPSLVARATTDLLNAVSSQYHRNMSPHHSLLKTRYGLYGNPFDMDMFDVELPHNLRQPPTPPSSYASAVAKNTSTFGGPVASNAVPPVVASTIGNGNGNGNGASNVQSREEPDLFEMLNNPLEKSGCSQVEFLRNHVLGLLEVEPLTFTCHATSDGTRVERVDASPHPPSSASGPTLNPVPLSMSGLGFDDTTPASMLPMGGPVGGSGSSASGSSGLVMADSLKKLAQMYAKQLHPGYKQIHQLISDHVSKAIETKHAHPPPTPPPLPPIHMNISMMANATGQQTPTVTSVSNFLDHAPTWKESFTTNAGTSTSSAPFLQHQQQQQQQQQQQAAQKAIPFSQNHSLLQPPPDQVMVIERMHSGARRFVTLDFGKPIVLTDVIIPACGDLASLSIDVWVQGEEIDGQRLVVAADIGTRTLVMNNIMPAPICRYLKIITVGRYGAGTTRSRIPLGPFYGHSYILPWEWREYADSHNYTTPSSASNSSAQSSPVKQLEVVSQSALLQHLGVFLSLQEDLQCRYSLACNRLSSLLSSVADAQFVSSHVKYYLKRGQRKSEEDSSILQSYNECLQLQLQLNLAQRAIGRLQRALGVKAAGPDDSTPLGHRLQHTSTDKLRVIIEGLLDTLLTLTVHSPALPQPPHPLYLALPPPTTESLFRNLCLLGSRRIQVSAGLLLSRVCGSQPWWGVFLGNVLREFFHSEYCTVFPQDRVFVLLSTLSQKALTGPSSVHILDSLLGMLTSVLQPLMSGQGSGAQTMGCLDLGMVSWILLFLCRNFDSALSQGSSDDSEKSSKREREGVGSSRWSFIQGSWTGAGSGSGKSKSRKLYSRSMQKRILHHKQRLHDIEAAKSMIEKAKDKVSHVVFKDMGSSKEKALLKEQETLRKELAQLRSKHFKDLIFMRRNDLEVLRRLPKEDREGPAGKDGDEETPESVVVLPRERCLLGVRGLMSLLLSMDFSCHVDLFLVACKVLAKICVVTRPALTLAEVMSQEQLERLILLAVHHDNSQGPSVWGGPWAAHAITCLLQDILEGEKQFPSSMTSSEEDLLGTEMADVEEQLAHSASSVNTDDGTDDDLDSAPEGGAEGGMEPSSGFKDTSLMMDLLLEDVMEDDYGDSFSIMDIPPPPPEPKLFSPYSSAFGKAPKKKSTGASTQQNGELDLMLSPPLVQAKGILDGKKTTADRIKKMKTKLNDLINTSKSSANSHGLSVAQDARLEFGLQWLPELRMRVMLSVHVENVFGAFTSSLPTPPQLPHMLSEPSLVTPPTDDELSQATLNTQNSLSSAAMLSQCFDHLFAQLSQGRVSLDSVLQLWLTLNQNCASSVADDHGPQAFNPARVPVVPLGPTAVVHLMEAVMAAPMVSVRSWVFVLHTLCLLTNQRQDAAASAGSSEEEMAVGGRETSVSTTGLDGVGNGLMASVVLTDPNLVPLILKFLSGSSANSPSSSGLQFYQVGPSATRAFDDFLHRLLCKSVDVNGQNLKELLLKIVYQLTADRGSISTCTGPLDAQCKFVESVSGVAFDTVDLSNAISVVASISSLVHQHIMCQDPIICSASHDASISARSCFSGLFASLLRGEGARGSGGEASRDQLMCSLLRLVNKLVQVSLPGTGTPRGNPSQGLSESTAAFDQVELQEGMSDAAKLNWAFSSSMVQPIPTIPMSDDEKRQQSNNSGGGSSATASAASSEVGSAADSSSSTEARPTGERYVADIILGNPHVMQSLIQALSFCSSNKMALILGSAPNTTTSSNAANPNDNFNMADPLSVGDGIYQILCTLLLRATNPNAVTESLFKYLSGSYPQLDSGALCRLSEPLLKFLLRVLDSPASIRHFVELGGVEVVCSSLVRSSQQFISVGPSIISTIMQNMTSTAAAAAEEKAKAADSDNVEGLFNFAPLGSIVSTSPTASPADALIQTSAPHRRARTAAWSYHFYPDEPWVELVITLPFAILLRQVQIRPHNGALTTCPSFVSLEISHDGQNVIPTSPPLVTCSLAVIKLQLLRPEVVNVVTLRLHRPRDSMTIGLQQVCLRGQRAFGEVTETSNAFMPCEDTMTRCSMGWLRLLHHCLMAHKEVEGDVARAAAPTCNVLNTCTSLLVSPATSLYATKIEAVLLRLGLSSVEIGLALIDNILRNPSQYGDRGRGHRYLGRVNGVATPYTVEILYQLGITQDGGTRNRVQALLQWLADSAQSFLRRTSSARENRMGVFGADPASPLSTSPASEHVHCVAAILWFSHELPVHYDLLSLITPDFIGALYEWANSLAVNSLLKKAVNHVLCSACHIHPPYFTQLLHWAGFLGNDLSAVATDDSKDDAQQQQGAQGPGAMTDDSKEANRQPLRHEAPSGTMTDDSKEATRLSCAQQALSSLSLDKGKLESVSVVCRSPAAVAQLLDSGLPTVLAQGLAEYCSRQITLIVERNLVSDAERLQQQQQQQQQQQPSADNGPRRGEWPDAEPDSNGLTAELVASILSFFAELCCEPTIKDWLGGPEGNVFWPALLTMLCNTSTQRPTVSTLSVPHRFKVMSVEERFLIESTAIQFFTQVIACHSVNQLFFAKVLCDVIREQGASRAGLLLGTVPLSGFTRRLLLQVLLEDEKITVALRASPEFYCRLAGNGGPSNGEKGLGCRIHHPCFGAGRGSCSITVNINSPCSEVLTRFGDPTAAAMVASSLLECRDDRKRAEDLAKESSDLGIEVMEYITAAGVLAKEKREKSPSPSKSGLPPRPPTRRGHRPSDSGLSGIKFPHCTLHLQHQLMKHKALPGDLTFSQLMQILLQRGLASGTTALPFTITLSTRSTVPPPTLQAALAAAQQGALGGIEEWGDNPEDIPDEILLTSPAFPSALQVFASVGGLALLAEHLPLLYPDITRQGTTTDVSTTDNNNVPDLGQDWVTVESSDELYDPYMEPVSPAPASSHAARHVAGAMPTIPPHSLIAFGLFLRLPGYAEVLLKERKKAQCLLRLVLGVTDDGDGGHILTSPIASSLPTLPFTVLKSLFDASPLTTDDGVLLRRMALDIGVLHLVLACLSVLSHHGPRVPISGFQQETQMILTAMQAAATQSGMAQSEEKTQHYWAKGTGFGTGSTTSSWDAEQALLRQRSEEEHVACLLQVLGSYINPGGHIPKDFFGEEEKDEDGVSTASPYTPPSEKWLLPEVVSDLLSQSCLIPAISSYLRNDSVLDMARHVPLYRALLQLLRGMAVCPPLVALLLPMPTPQSLQQNSDTPGTYDTSVSVEKLLAKMKGCVDTYASRLKSNKGKTVISSKADEEESEGLALLIPDIQESAGIVKLSTQRLKEAEADHADSSHDGTALGASACQTTEERYLALMGPLQFDTYELVTEEGRGLKFNIPHHFESNVKASGAFNNPARTRRLAQEAVTLSTSLPLSYNSSVFVRCDEERLDIMKVLITGPSDTPYANGAFEFDVYFPQDYPNSPPYINLETTGNHTVRFNPNLYNDGKVCLSILNTWHGRPEEKWNAQTSSFLQVLVSIQSLILVSEPYFNEPGYERSRCTPSGTASSREYDANIRQATVKWAMLEQLRHTSPCFKEVIQYHFWMKRHEVLKQCEEWIAEMEQYSSDKRTGRSISHSTMALKRHYNQLREELAKLKPPPELGEESEIETIDPKGKQYSTDSPQASAATAATATSTNTSSMVPKPTGPPATSTLSAGSVGLGPYVGPNGMFFNDPCEPDLPDV